MALAMIFGQGRAGLVMLTIALLIGAMHCATNHAAAQGTFGTLPQPITSGDLDRYAEQLALSDEQVLAITEHHREYLERFRELRDSDVDKFLVSMQDIRRNFSLSNLSRFEPMIREINRLMGRIRAVDEQFFNQTQTALTDEQVRRMPRIRQQRERARYGSELTRGLDFINPGARLDLTEIIEQLDLPQDVFNRIDPHMAQYENRLTTMARTMWDTTAKTFIDAIREIDALGLDQQDLSEPAQMMRLFQESQRIWDEVSEDLLEESSKLAALHRQQYRAIAPLLPDETRRSLRQRFLQRAYPEASRLTVEAWREVDKALSLDEMPARLRENVIAMANNHDQQQERRINQIADLLDEFRSSLTMQRMIRRDQDSTIRRVNELREEGELADRQFIENLHATLGETWSVRVMAAPTPRRQTSRPPVARFDQAFAIDESTPQPGMRWPRPMTSHDLTRIGDMLELRDDQRAILAALHEDYTAEFNDARRRHMPGMLNLMIVPGDDSGGFMRELDDDEFQQLIGMVRAAIDDLRTIDEEFFNDIASAILGREGSDKLAAVRAMRECRLYLEATPDIPPQLLGGPMNNPGNSEGAVKFREILGELSLSPDQRRRIENAFIEHELAASDLLRERFDVDVVLSLHNWQIAVRMQNPEDRRPAWRAIRDRAEPMRQSQATNRELALLNRATLNAALELAPQREQSTFRDRYNRQAFPTIYDDPTSPEPKLLAAMNLPELSDRQRARVQDLIMEFRVEYQRLSQEMVEHHMDLSNIEAPERRGRQRPGQPEPPEVIERDGLRNAIERVMFDRTELNQRITRRLRAVLNEEQYNRLSMNVGG